MPDRQWWADEFDVPLNEVPHGVVYWDPDPELTEDDIGKAREIEGR